MEIKIRVIYFLLILYVVAFFFLAVLNRGIVETKNTIRLDLFQGYIHPVSNSYRDIIINIVCFVPVGLLTGIIIPKHRVLNALLVGLPVSLIVECSQLALKRGVFDVDDLFNNSVGALIGGAIVWFTTIGSRLRVHG